MIESQTQSATHATPKIPRANPLSLLISLIKEKGGGAEQESVHQLAFRRLLDEPGYEDFRDAIIDEWIRIKYSTAFQAAHPPTPSEIKQRREFQKEVRADATRQRTKFKMKITERALSLMMPNGKRLAKCTGAECIAFGGWFAKIGEKVGPDKMVGEVLTNGQLAQLTKA